MTASETPYQAGTFDAATAQKYMNPYLEGALAPQLAEARRQADITRVQQAGQMTKAGAFGGGRQAVMEAEGARNLGTNLANITGQGYNTAYQQALAQYNTEQQRQLALAQQQEATKQFGANYGLSALQGALGAASTQGSLGGQQAQSGLAALQAQLGAGAVQQGIEQAGLTADQAAFNAARDNPYKMVQYQQSLLQGLPLSAQSYNISSNPYSAAANAATGIASYLYPTATTPAK
jgi:hypothetical protein